MATKIVVPELPTAALELAAKDEMLAELLDGFRMPIRMANDSFEKLYRLAVQDDTIAERIETGDDDASVAFRQVKAEQEANVAAAEAALKAAEEAAQAKIDEAYEEAAKGVRTDEDVTAEDGVKAIERIKMLAARTARDTEILGTYGYGEVMGDWRIPLPSGARGKGAVNRNGEDKGFYPQFSKITVDGKIKDYALTNLLVKDLKISRNAFIGQLETAANGKDGWQALDPGAEVPVTLTINDKPVRIVVTKGQRAARSDAKVADTAELDKAKVAVNAELDATEAELASNDEAGASFAKDSSDADIDAESERA
jgi:hypothetical protein